MTADLRNSSQPQWIEVRDRLDSGGIRPEDAVLGIWHSAGPHSSTGIIVGRDDRVFLFGVTVDFDNQRQPLNKGEGWIHKWKELSEDDVTLTSTGHPDIYTQARLVARLVFEQES